MFCNEQKQMVKCVMAGSRFVMMVLSVWKIMIRRFGQESFSTGLSGADIPLFKRQIANGGSVTVTDKKIIRYFMTILEASQLVLQSGAIVNNGELFVLDMGQPVKIMDLAENMMCLSGV